MTKTASEMTVAEIVAELKRRNERFPVGDNFLLDLANRLADEPKADLACKLEGACAWQNSVRQMCWPCQIRWHRQQAADIERALLAGEKPKRVEPRGDDRQAEPRAPPLHPFVVKHYSGDERPTIKGNGFDGLEIGADREEAEDFVNWLNERLGVNRKGDE